MQKVNVAVLRGGTSGEFDVSMRTGGAVIDALKGTEYEPIDVMVTKSGEWIRDGYVRDVEHALALADVVFIALHGTYGEDGTVQRILDRHNIPYTGSRAHASSIAMNKYLTKEHLRNSGIRMAPHMRVTRSTADIGKIADTIDALFGPEFVIKPVSGGSSLGTSFAHGALELSQMLTTGLKQWEELLVEKRIRGRETTCGVIERFRDSEIYALPPIEIIPPHTAEFFSYEAKYSDETLELCPARFASSEKADIELAAKKVHQLLGLHQYSRADFILADDGLYFLEVNTLPGLTETSLLPKGLEAIGCEYRNFLRHLLTDARGGRI